MFALSTDHKIGAGIAAFALVALCACDTSKHKSPAAVKAETKRQQAACASPVAYERLKNSIFDEAIARGPIDKSNLDTLADYSIARMENPLVEGWDQSLDITRCKGHFILEVPPGAERGLGGARQLEANIDYTAQPSADGAGLVYQQRGADAIVAKLASFKLSAATFRPPPAIDQDQPESSIAQQITVREAQSQQPLTGAPEKQAAHNIAERSQRDQAAMRAEPSRAAERPPAPLTPRPSSPALASGGEGTVRAFYTALGAGNGSAAASQVVPEKRSRGPFSAGAISRFYGRLPEPIQLTSVASEGDAFRVTYRYSAGRSRCNGIALVRVTNRGGRNLISSIRSLSGC